MTRPAGALDAHTSAAHHEDDPRWRDDAACRNADPDTFYPKRYDEELVAAARAVCGDCPVAVACLDYALAAHEKHGMWGGLSPSERSRVRRKRAERARMTMAAAVTKPCSKCRETLPLSSFRENRPGVLRAECNDCHRAYEREWRRRKREGVA